MMKQLFESGNDSEKKGEQLKSRLKEEHRWLGCIYAEEKAYEKRNFKTISDIFAKRERELEAINQRQQQQQMKQQRIKKEEFIKSLKEKRREAELDISVRKQLKNNPEIKELERYLLIAKVAREQEMQRNQAIALKKLKKEEDEEFAKQLIENAKKEELLVRENEMKKKFTQKEYLEALDKQRKCQSAHNKDHKKELDKEKETIDKMVESILREDMENKRKIHEEREKYRKEVKECKAMQSELSKLNMQKNKIDEEKAESYKLMINYRNQVWNQQKRAELELKLQRQQLLQDNFIRLVQEKKCEDDLMTEINIQEKELKEQQEEKIKAEKQALQKAELQEANFKQKWLQQQQKKIEKEEEKLFTQSMVEQLYEYDNLAVLSDIKKKEKEKEHRKMILEMIKDRKKRKDAEKQKEIEELLFQKDLDNKKREIIEQERKRILRENRELLSFLPKEALKNYKEIDELGKEIQQVCITKAPTDDQTN